MPALEALSQASLLCTARTRPLCGRVCLMKASKACFGLVQKNDEGEV